MQTIVSAQAPSIPQQTPVLTSDRVCSTHLTEWVEGSAVSEEIARLNIESLSADELNERVKPKTPIQTGGWWTGGVNWRTGLPMGTRYGQAKPDQPHDLGNGKKAKYLTASGMEPDGIFLAMPNPNYWLDTWADKKQPLFITEGAKKAGAGLSLGLPTIAVTGVWNWGKDGALAPELKKFVQPGRKVYLCFDEDYQQNPSCRAALHKLGTLITEEGCEVKIPIWEGHKGMDDFIVAEGGEAFKAVVASAETLKQWEKQFKQEKPSKAKQPPTPKALADELSEKFRDRWAYDLGQQTWRIWNDAIWEKRHDKACQRLLKAQVQAMNIDYPRESYIKDALESLSLIFLRETWDTFDRSKWIAGKNGILNTTTGQVEPHQPGFGFTSVLPHEVQPFSPARTEDEILSQLQETCPEIHHFLSGSVLGDKRKTLKLLAVVAGVLRFRFAKLQKFVHLIGEPGTGKGTFMRLLKDVVGVTNTQSASLTNLHDGSVMARIIDAQLALFPDERKQVGVEWLLKLTGGDDIDYRKVYTAGGNSPFHGSVVVASNSPVFSGDTTGLDRRLCLIPFLNVIPDHQRDPDLQDRIKAEVPSLVSVALAMPLALVDDLICGRGIGAMEDTRWHEWQMKVLMDKVAAFIDEKVVTDESGAIGATDVFDAYLEWAKTNNHSNAGSLTFFGQRFRQHVKWLGVSESKRLHGRVRYTGIRLRFDGESTPHIQDQLSPNCPPDPLGDTLGDTWGTPSNPLPEPRGDTRDTSPIKDFSENQQILSPEKTPETKKIEPESVPSVPSPLPEPVSECPPTPHPTVTGEGQGVTLVAAQPAQPVEQFTDKQLFLALHKRSAKSAYPNPNSDNEQASFKRAMKLRKAIAIANTKEDLSALRRENGGAFGEAEIIWVSRWLKALFPNEHARMMETREISQLNLGLS